MDRFECLLAFSHVYESGSFSAAAARLNTSQPTVSKRIAMLEAELGTPLFLRSTRKLVAVPEAHEIYQKARIAIESFEEARAIAGRTSPEISGRLSLSLPGSMGRTMLMPLLARFMRDHPQVDLDIRMSDRMAGMIDEGIELAVRVGELTDSSMRARLLCRAPRYAVASPEYLRNHPAPSVPGELSDHVCIGYAGFGEPSNWIFEGEMGRHVVKVDPKVRFDDADAMLELALTGIGVAVLPGWLAAGAIRDGRLEQLLPEFMTPGMPVNVVMLQNVAPSPRARTFVNFLLENRSAIATWVVEGPT